MDLNSITNKNLKIFQGINEATVIQILENAEKEQFAAGEVIMEQGEYPDGKGYIIKQWSVDVWVNGDQTATLAEWDMFGEIALLNEEPRSATIVAQTPLTAIVLSQDILFQMIQNDDNTINKEIMRRMEENLENE